MEISCIGSGQDRDPISTGIGVLLFGLFIPVLIALSSDPAWSSALDGVFAGFDFQLRTAGVALCLLGLPGFFMPPKTVLLRMRVLLWSLLFFVAGLLVCAAGVFLASQAGLPMLGLFMSMVAAVSVGLFYIFVASTKCFS